ncbi:hypothetical protein OSB04_017854 [Centaurea solstitialis]|uniref:F-box domain-containing protein n=1 Tax=Centaurea solstitialis TaxID=347529 RepID=A0AA38T5B9_9ASTR|nr:hypothetical protein OSB04_017854 [Centaurea solstitialis]
MDPNDRNPRSSSRPAKAKRRAEPETPLKPLFNIDVSHTGFNPQYPPDYAVEISPKGFSLKISHPGSSSSGPSQALHPASVSQTSYQPFPPPDRDFQNQLFSPPNWGPTSPNSHHPYQMIALLMRKRLTLPIRGRNHRPRWSATYGFTPPRMAIFRVAGCRMYNWKGLHKAPKKVLRVAFQKKMADLPPRRPSTIECLPGELLSEILIRVSAKPLARMRSVSKPWNHLLSQPSFIKSHLHHSLHINNNNDEILLVLLSGNYDDSFSVTAHLSRSPHLRLPDFFIFPNNPDHCNLSVTFLGSVNGLICYGFRTYPNDYLIQIWNPSLSAVLTLPPFNGLDWFLIDDSTHEFHFRFGYDPKTDDYKLVKFMSYMLPPADPIDYSYPDIIQARRYFLNDRNDVKEVEVYSMRNGSWKLIENRLPSHVIRITDEDVVCADGHDGILHWIGSVNGNKQTIVTFDLGVETFGEICLSNSVILERDWNGLGFYSGRLCVMSCKKGYEYEVWVMNEYGVAESWTKLRIFSDFGVDIDPHGFTASNKFLFSINSDSIYIFDQLKIYDPDADEVKSFETDARDSVWTKVVCYVDSLVWVAPTKQIQPAAEISQIER